MDVKPITFKLMIFIFRDIIINPTNIAGIVAKKIGKKLTFILWNSKYLFLNKYNNSANNDEKWAVVSYKKFLSPDLTKINSIKFRWPLELMGINSVIPWITE